MADERDPVARSPTLASGPMRGEASKANYTDAFDAPDRQEVMGPDNGPQHRAANTVRTPSRHKEKDVQSIQEVMTRHPMAYPATATISVAARAMRDNDVGDVLVERDGTLFGIVTDRDIVVRVVAEDCDLNLVSLGDICTQALVTLSPTDSVEDAVRLMRTEALRRLPVCDGGKPVGIVSLGDLALERDPESALADISAARPTS